MTLSAAGTNSTIGGTAAGNSPQNVTVDAVANRVVAATPVDLGLVHAGQSAGGSTLLSTTGDNSHYTAVTVPGGTDGLATVSAGTATFNGDGVCETRAVTTGTLNAAGVFGGAVTLATSGEGLAGESPVNVSVPYTVQVFSGIGQWTGSSGSLWIAGSNWSDVSAAGVHAAPGTFAAFAGSDTASFCGAGSVTQVSLAGANPSLAALVFSGSDYALSDGALTLASSGGMPAITVGDSSMQTISSTIAGTQGLLKEGPGELVLSGSNTYSGGTTVDDGTLCVTSSTALPDGSSLTVGAGGSFVFDRSAAAATATGRQAVTAIPEPGTLARSFVHPCGYGFLFRGGKAVVGCGRAFSPHRVAWGQGEHARFYARFPVRSSRVTGAAKLGVG